MMKKEDGRKKMVDGRSQRIDADSNGRFY